MKTSMTTLIAAPAKIVFLWLEEDERLKQWVPNLVEDEVLVETPEKVGSKFRQVFLDRGKRMEMTGEITEYIEDERIRVYMTGDMFDLDVLYWLKTLSQDQTEVTQDTEIFFKGFLKIFAPIFSLFSKFSKNNPQADAHALLKEYAEREYQETR